MPLATQSIVLRSWPHYLWPFLWVLWLSTVVKGHALYETLPYSTPNSMCSLAPDIHRYSLGGPLHYQMSQIMPQNRD